MNKCSMLDCTAGGIIIMQHRYFKLDESLGKSEVLGNAVRKYCVMKYEGRITQC